MCSAMLSGAPGSWHTYEINDCASAVPAARKSTARSVSSVSGAPRVIPCEAFGAAGRGVAYVTPGSATFDVSVPRVVAQNGTGHASWTSARPNELGALEGDRRTLAF